MKLKPGSMGKPAPGYDVRIVDDCGMEVSEGSEGNIAVNCENSKMDGVLFDGYVGDEEKTKKAFLNNFYLTGDRGFVDQDGFIWFKSRQDDVIISAGYRIGPFEVESGTQLFTSSSSMADLYHYLDILLPRGGGKILMGPD